MGVLGAVFGGDRCAGSEERVEESDQGWFVDGATGVDEAFIEDVSDGDIVVLSYGGQLESSASR